MELVHARGSPLRAPHAERGAPCKRRYVTELRASVIDVPAAATVSAPRDSSSYGNGSVNGSTSNTGHGAQMMTLQHPGLLLQYRLLDPAAPHAVEVRCACIRVSEPLAARMPSCYLFPRLFVLCQPQRTAARGCGFGVGTTAETNEPPSLTRSPCHARLLDAVGQLRIVTLTSDLRRPATSAAGAARLPLPVAPAGVWTSLVIDLTALLPPSTAAYRALDSVSWSACCAKKRWLAVHCWFLF